MTADERNSLYALEVRLFGLDGESGLYGDVQQIKLDLAEWRGAIRLVKAGGAFLGIGGVVTIVAALLSVPRP